MLSQCCVERFFKIAERVIVDNFLFDCKTKFRAFTIRALNFQFAVHHIQQSLRNIHAKPCTFNSSITLFINSLKRTEKFLYIILPDSDSCIFHGIANFNFIIRNFFALDNQRNSSMFCIFNGVRQNICGALFNSDFIAKKF